MARTKTMRPTKTTVTKIINPPTRKRAAPTFFLPEDFAAKKAKSPATGSTGFVFLAVKTDDDPDGFYLARAGRSDYPSNGEFSIRWLSKLSPRGGTYKLDFSDKIHPKMVIGEVELETINTAKFRLSAKERKRIMSEDEESESSDESDVEETPKKSPKKRVSPGNKKEKPAKRAKKEKKEKPPKKPKRLPKNYIVPNEELVPNPKIKLFPDSDDGFLASASSNVVSGIVASKTLIRAVIRGDAKLVQQLVDDPSKCPNLFVPRSVDIGWDAMSYALIMGHTKIIKILANEMHSPKCKKRPAIEQPLLSSVSSGSYNFRSLGIPVIREVMMSRGGREGVNALTQDTSHYNPEHTLDCSFEILQHNIPLSTVHVLETAIEEASNVSTGNNFYHGYRGRGRSYGNSNILESLIQKIDYVMIHGHWELAGRLVELAKSMASDTFNYLHVAALTKTDTSTIGPIRAASVTKKTMRNMNISPLHCAAINPNQQFLQQFLNVSPDYNITDKRGRRPIHFAAACQTSGPIKVLLSAGVPYIEPDSTGGTPLIYASIVGRTENVKLLLEQAKKDQANQTEDTTQASAAVVAKYGPCAINKTARDGKGALHHAASNGCLEICRLLVSNGAVVDLVGGSEKKTALMMAATYGHLPIVKYLIEDGKALAERRDKKGRTALIFAVKNGHAHITAYLLRMGVNPNAADTSGNTALHYAAAYGWLDCLNLLLAAGAECKDNDWDMSPLSISFLKGHLGITRELLKQPGADVNFGDKNGRTLVMLTCQGYISEALYNQLNFLITQVKADASRADIYGCNALHFLSCTQGMSGVEKIDEIRIRMAALLVKAGCSPSHMNDSRRTPVNAALENHQGSLVEFLLSKGGVISHQPFPGTLQNSFHVMASHCMFSDYSNILDQLKAKVDKAILNQMIKAKDSQGFTPLMEAAKTYFYAQVPFAKDSKEYKEAASRGISFLTRLVEDFGADIKEAAESVGLKKQKSQSDEESSEESSEEEEEEQDDQSTSSDEEEVQPQKPKVEFSTFVHYLLLPNQAPPALDFIRKFRPPLNHYNSSGETVAISVAAQGNIESVRLLIELGADLNLTTKEPYPTPGVTPLLVAAQKSRIELVKFLIEKADEGKIDLNAIIPLAGDSISSLLCAIDSSNVDLRLNCLELLAAKKKLDPNFANKSGRTLLMMAVGANKRQVDSSNAIEQFLLSKGADCLNRKDDHGRNALHWVFLSANDTQSAPKMIDATFDPVDLLNMLLASKPNADVNGVKDAFERGPLHYAAADGATICCLRLLARGASIDATDKNGDTPLSLAVRHARKSVVLILVQSKPDFGKVTVANNEDDFIEPTKPKGRELVEWYGAKAAKLGLKIGHPLRVDLFSGVIRLQWQGLTSLLIDILIEKNPLTLYDLISSSITSATYNLASTLLTRAMETADLRDRIKRKANSSIPNLFALMALRTTVEAGSNKNLVLKVAGQIEELGVNPTAVDGHGCTPLHYACLNHYQPLVEYFAAKSKPGYRNADNYGRSPIHALFWNLFNYTSACQITDLLTIVAKVDGAINIPVKFAPLQHAVPPSSENCSFAKSDYFANYDSVPSTTCLIRAVQSGFFTLVATALKEGASADAKGAHGLTPLMAAIQENSVESFLVLMSEKTQNEVFDHYKTPAQKTMKLNDRVILKYLKPLSEGGSNLTPKELKTMIDNILNANKEPAKPAGPIPTFSASNFLFAQPQVEEDESEKSENSEEESGEDEEEESSNEEEDQEKQVDQGKEKETTGNLASGEKLPFLIPTGVAFYNYQLGRAASSCSIDFSILRQIELPKNERHLDLMATETKGGNTALDIAMSSVYRNTLEARFMAYALAEMDKRILNSKEQGGLSPEQLLKPWEKAPSMSRSQSSVLRAAKAVDLDKISEDWMSHMEKLADKKRKQEVEDKNKELIPDSRFTSYLTSKLVRDQESQRLYNALMTKIDLHKGGSWTEFNFYQLQLIRMENTGLYVVFTRWGRIGDSGMYQQTPFKVLKDAETEFCKIFRQKTGNDWRKDSFTKMPNRYRLVSLDKPDRFTQLTSVKIDMKVTEEMTSLPKEEFQMMKSIVESSLDSVNDGTIFQRLNNIHLTPFGLIAPQSLKDASRVLKELRETVSQIERGSQRTAMTYDQRLAIYEKIGRLSEEYYHIVPRTGFAYCEVYPLTDSNAVNNEMKKIDILLNFQASTRLLLAAEQNKAKENPCDFVLSCLGMAMRPVNPGTQEAQDILRYAMASWSPNDGGIEVIYKLDRPREVDQQAALKLGNRRLLWHGTRLQNLLGIFSTGLQASPEGVHQTGQLWGDGVYLSDAFAKSVMYCDNTQGKPSYVFLCDVALGTCAYIDQNGPGNDEAKRAANTMIAWYHEQPDARFTATTADNVSLPYGGRINIMRNSYSNFGHYSTGHTEYVVKNSKQIVLKYLVKFWQR